MEYPEYLTNACAGRNHPPNPNRMSVTDLINPPLIRTLTLEHWEEIERIPEESIWMLLGTALDTIVKNNSNVGLTKLKLEWPTIHGLTLVGVPDYINILTHIMADLKTTSVWKFKGKIPPDYINQLNIYDYLLRKLFPDIRIDKLQIHAILRDWRWNESVRYPDYPDTQFLVVDIPRWTVEEQTDYIDTQLQDHIKHSNRECTPEEKWQSPDQYAVMKGGRKSALRVLDSKKEAVDWCRDNGHVNSALPGETNKLKGYISIVKRPGACTRCERYCAVNKWCPYYKAE